MANVQLSHANHLGLTHVLASGEVRLQVLAEKVAGGAGFANVTGAVTIDLSLGEIFLHTATGDLTGPTFTNVPSDVTTAAAWTWVLDTGAAARTLTGTPTVTWLDGRSWSDLNLSAGVVNIVEFWRLGTVTYAHLVRNGNLVLDPYKVAFLADGGITIMTEAEEVDVANATQYGSGTVTFRKNGVAITTRTLFAVGDRLGVACSGAGAETSVRIPRYLP